MIPRNRPIVLKEEAKTPPETETIPVTDVDLDYGSKVIALRLYPEDSITEHDDHFLLIKATGERVILYKAHLLAYATKDTAVTRQKESKTNG